MKLQRARQLGRRAIRATGEPERQGRQGSMSFIMNGFFTMSKKGNFFSRYDGTVGTSTQPTVHGYRYSSIRWEG